MDENGEKPKSMLSEDVIYGIAEKMFFKKPFGNKGLAEIDLTKQNPYTIFMGHCQVHLNAMMAQFAKLKRVEFRKSSENKDMVSFYKYKEGNSPTNLDIKDAFSGPYRVTKPMAFGVIEYGKLRVSAVHATNYLKKEKTNDDDVHAAKKKPIEVFAALFLDQNMSEKEIAKNCELNIEHLHVRETADVIEANLLSLLALNSTEIELNPFFHDDNYSYSESIFFGSSNQIIENAFANKTKEITVENQFSLDSPIEDFNNSFCIKWQQQARFLIQSCPNMEQLNFQLSIYFTHCFILEQILQQIRAVLNAIRQLLEQMDGGGSNEKLRVCVEFTSACAEQGSVETLKALDNSTDGGQQQQIFKLGSSFAIAEFEDDEEDDDYGSPYIARSLEIVDAAGRAHLCEFKVYEERPPSPESSSDFSDLSEQTVHNDHDYDG